MRICSQCGASIYDDDALYCPTCGTSLSAQAAVSQPAETQAADTQSAGAAGYPGAADSNAATDTQSAGAAGYPGAADSNAAADTQSAGAAAQPNPYASYGAPQQPAYDDSALRSAGYRAFIDALASQRMLVLNILYSCSIGLSAIATLKQSTTVYLPLTLIFPLLWCGAFWWLYSSARATQQGGTFNPGGLKLFKISAMVYYILGWVLCGLGMIVVFGFGSLISSPWFRTALIESGIPYDMNAMTGILGVMAAVALPIFAGFIVLSVFFYIKLMHTLKALTSTAETGLPTAFVSQFLIVMDYILGVLIAIFSLISLTSSGSVASLLSQLAQAAYLILLASGMQQYQRQVTAIWQQAGRAPYME